MSSELYDCKIPGCSWQGASYVAVCNHERTCSMKGKRGVKRKLHGRTILSRVRRSLPKNGINSTSPGCETYRANLKFVSLANDMPDTTNWYENTSDETGNEELTNNDVQFKTSSHAKNQMYSCIRPEVTKSVIENTLLNDKSRKEISEAIGVTLCNISRKSGCKDIDDLITLLHNPSFDLENFRSRCGSAADCRGLVNNIFKSDMDRAGFRLVNVQGDEDSNCQLYMKSVVSVLQEQVRMCSSNYMYTSHSDALLKRGDSPTPHPMLAAIGRVGAAHIETCVKSSTNPGHVWFDSDSHKQSFPGLVQVYTDKSNSSLKSSAFTFYPIHATLLNFDDCFRRGLITSNKTVIGYLPVSFFGDNTSERSISDYNTNAVNRTQRQKLLHACLKIVLSELSAMALEGFLCTTSDGKHVVCHNAVASYCADIPEAKDVLGVMHGNVTAMACHRCQVKSVDLAKCTDCAPRTLASEGRIREEYECLVERSEKLFSKRDKRGWRRMQGEAATILKNRSLSIVPPALRSHPFSTIGMFDSYGIFHFEPMHNLHLGITKLLLVALSERLRSMDLRTKSFGEVVVDGARCGRQLGRVRTKIIGRLNHFMRVMDLTYSSNGFRVDFGSSKKSGHFNGLFNEQGLVGMLEARDYKCIEMILPFIGCHLDSYCGTSMTAKCTKMLTLYTTMITLLYSNNGDEGWSEEGLQNLKRCIRKFKILSVEFLGPYQKSGMGTLKFHMLDHVVQDIATLGGVQFSDASFYEHSHVYFKKLYRSTSRRHNTAMAETLRAIGERDALLHWCEGNYVMHEMQKRRLNRSKNGSSSQRKGRMKTEALLDDSIILPKEGQRLTLKEIITAVKYYRLNDGPTEGISKQAMTLLQDIGEDAISTFEKEMLSYCGISNVTSLREVVMQRVSSGFLCGRDVPSSTDYVHSAQGDETKVLLTNSRLRYMQRIVAVRNFYGNSKLRQDFVMLKGPEHAVKNASGTSQRRTEVWFARILCLLRLGSAGNNNEVDGNWSTSAVSEREAAFVQYMEVIELESTVDHAVGCAKLRWARNDGTIPPSGHVEEPKISPGKWFGMTPASSIIGAVHIVPCVVEDESTWETESFYVNRFFRYPRVDWFRRSEDLDTGPELC